MILVNIRVVCQLLQLVLTCTCGIIYPPNLSTVMNNKKSVNNKE